MHKIKDVKKNEKVTNQKLENILITWKYRKYS